jgi:DNA-binding transcriptional MerR regulator
MTSKLYKAADVCEMAQLQPYVLRSWEKEFPGIGVQKSPDSARVYRQADVDQVLRIKQLVFGEGLTLAGARRRLDEQPSPVRVVPMPMVDIAAEADDSDAAIGREARATIATVRQGLRLLLDALSAAPGVVAVARAAAVMPDSELSMTADAYELRPQVLAAPPRVKAAPPKPKTRAVASRGKAPRVAGKPAHRAKPAGSKRKRASA